MTLWADVSQYQPLADDTYPHRAFCFRTNSGSAQDINADANAAWAKQALDDGRLDIVIGYYFFRPGQANCDLHWQILERAGLAKHDRVATMIDVEGAPGKDGNRTITGDQSAEVNDEHGRLVQWWGGETKRVIGYQNEVSDPDLWPTKPAGLMLVIPSYTGTPGTLATITTKRADLDRMLAHQYGDDIECAPFGACDSNFTALAIPELADALGLTSKGPAPMTPAQDALYQIRGDADGSLNAGHTGFRFLKPFDGWSAALGKVVDRLSVPEAIGQLVHELTYRVPVFRAREKANTLGTNLDHSAAAHGGVLDVLDSTDRLELAVTALDAKFDALVAAIIQPGKAPK